MDKHEFRENLSKKGAWIKRIAWIGMIAFLILVFAGAAGVGPLTKNKVRSGSVEVTYHSMVRYEREEDLLFSGFDGTVLELNHGFLEKVDIRRMIPEPENQVLTGEGVRYHYAAESPGTVIIRYAPVKTGHLPCRIRVGEKILVDDDLYIIP